MAGGNKLKAKDVPLSDRTFIIGDQELMGYVGVKSTVTLHELFLDKGLRPASQIGRNKYYRRSAVDKFIEDNSEWQEVHVRPGRPRTKAIV